MPAVDLFQADYAILNGPKDTVDLVDAATLEQLADALESVVRDLAK